MLKLMTTETCTYCANIKAELSRKGIEYEALDLYDNVELAMDKGIMGAPALIDGDDVYIGQGACMSYLEKL